MGYTSGKLTKREVNAIRKSKKSTRELAERYNVCKNTIINVRKGRTYQHVAPLPAKPAARKPAKPKAIAIKPPKLIVSKDVRVQKAKKLGKK